ncbi:protein XRI1-like isoform X2 [Prosopis cineraria]|uniref:protein XRI1-like isoform X2 n=1 Tax=Prosopis cineraria TaxID=364024 RepID=UPI00241059F1|nr:protein XRI1-like isoform X2 [Prosopis cineraria]
MWEPWGWQKEVNCLQKTSTFDMSQELWNEVPQNEDESSHVFDDETTPVKACGDLAYRVTYSGNIVKEPEECRETSLLKRRRMLQFHLHSNDVHVSLSNEEMSSACLKFNDGKEDLIEDAFPDISQWVPGTSGSASASSYEDLELSAEGWLAECFNDAEMEFNTDYMNVSGAGDVQIDVAELCDIQPANEQNVVKQHATRPHRNVIFKGRKSMIQMPTKLATSVAYPFAFIKPSGAQGDVTLKEINQRIQTRTYSKSKPKVEDPSSYPKSAFSGKPVVGKTKIRTEGGKGTFGLEVGIGLGKIGIRSSLVRPSEMSGAVKINEMMHRYPEVYFDHNPFYFRTFYGHRKQFMTH